MTRSPLTSIPGRPRLLARIRDARRSRRERELRQRAASAGAVWRVPTVRETLDTDLAGHAARPGRHRAR